VTAPLLLDTCALLWLAGTTTGTRLPVIEDALEAALDAGQDVLLSPITAWELGMLSAKGRVPVTSPLGVWLDRLIAASGLRWAELSPRVLIEANFLPEPIHPDPADRIIIATAREHGLRIVTRDRKILDYAGKGHVMAMAC